MPEIVDLVLVGCALAACGFLGAVLWRACSSRRRYERLVEQRFVAAVARGDLDEAERCVEQWFALTGGGHGDDGGERRAAQAGPDLPYWRSWPPWLT